MISTKTLIEQWRADGDALLAYVRACCERIEAREPTLHALLPEPDREARLLADAQSLIDRYPDANARPPLFGLLVGVKELFHVEGLVTRAGSNLPPALFAGPEAGVVSVLKAQGALVLGQTVATEFAFADPGPTRNPQNPEHTPGGSSSGSAAAVAAGYCPLALGTQTIGSIGRPASYCGVIGYKPSRGRISTAGCVPFSASADHVGFFAPDLTAVECIAPCCCIDWASERVGKPRAMPEKIGVVAGRYLEQAEPEMRAAYNQYIERLSDTGIEMVFVDLFSDWDDLVEIHYDLIAAEMAAFHAPWFDAQRAMYRPGSVELIERGRQVSVERLAAARAGQALLRNRIDRMMAEEQIQLWFTPSATGPAPEGIDYTGNPRMNLPWSYTGLPTISVPFDTSPAGLPLGAQWVGPWYGDEEMVALVQALPGSL